MNKNLDRLEAHLRNIFEENFLRIIPGNHSPITLFNELIESLHKNTQQRSDGLYVAPNEYKIHIPPQDLTDWQAHQDILDEMADFLYETGKSYGYYINQRPTVQLIPDDNAPNHGFMISTRTTPEKSFLSDTSTMIIAEAKDFQDVIPQHAFLIVGGRENFLLEKSVVNIGRHSNNDLILDEVHISRHHAQLRAINKRYIIFDVGSTGGVFVNGKQISQATLHPGDVIRIGLVNLIFVQDVTNEHPTKALPLDEWNDLEN